jgi:hypothetical protein
MTPAEVAAIVESMAQSLKSDPGQFQVNVTTTATQSFKLTNDGKGGDVIGMTNSVVGGAPGSSAVANQVSANTGAKDLVFNPNAQRRHEEIRDGNVAKLVATLSDVAAELRAPEPSKTKLEGFMDVIKQGWVPPLITAIIKPLLDMVRG